MKSNFWLPVWTVLLCLMLAACGGSETAEGEAADGGGNEVKKEVAAPAAASSDDGLVGKYEVSFDMEELMKGEEMDSASLALAKSMLDMMKMDMEFTKDGKTIVSGGMADMMEEAEKEGAYEVKGDQVMLKMTNDQEESELFDYSQTNDGFKLSQDSITMIFKRK